jgi:hypothetical protein
MRKKHTGLAAAVVIALAGTFAPLPASGQQAASAEATQGIPPASVPDIPRPAVTQPRLWSLFATASNVFESNIDRNQENNRAEGLVLGVGGQYRNRVDRPSFTAQYQVGGHMYAGAPRWDRISHNARAAYERRLLKALTFEAIGELSIKGSTEDRELGNQYIVSPRLQYRLTRNYRVEIESGYRVKHYEDGARNATNPYGGLRLTRRFGAGRWDVGYRYEENHSDTARNRYIRSTYRGDLIVPVTSRDNLGVELKVRSRRYERLVRIGDRRVPLTDMKWSVSPEWVHVLSPRLQLRASYEFESRGANDPGRNYGAHSTLFAVEHRW